MGTADIKYGDTIAFIQHLDTGLWLSYQTFETKKRGVGRVEEKKVKPASYNLMDVEFNYLWKIVYKAELKLILNWETDVQKNTIYLKVSLKGWYYIIFIIR